ncbi:MAG: hypothetical protein EZS28_035306 [Streblomastix strix]|uniref:Uncharacterized protein n=1 Tax=Streblomastix strix TaxID=222440 RepID=A0A5J4UEV8_9EUKA|nr:MAG: hypothetical protein EZS28_035306 [Streblomastix strix]
MKHRYFNPNDQIRRRRKTAIKHQRSQKKQKGNQAEAQFYYNNYVFDSHHGLWFSQMSYQVLQRSTPDQSYMKLRTRQPTDNGQQISPPAQTDPQSQTTSFLNQNQSSILNTDLVEMITNPFTFPKRLQHQQNVEEAAQVQLAPIETFPTYGKVRKVVSSKDCIVLGQIGDVGTKLINIQTVSSTQLQGNPIREPKVQKKGGKAPVRSNATSTNASVLATQNQNEDQQH